MKIFLHFLFICILFFAIEICNAQSISQQVATSSGNYFSSPSGSLSWTIGEPLYETAAGQNNTLTQGFQQPTLAITPIVNEQTNDEVQIKIFPNPSPAFLNIQYNSSKQMTGALYDLSGKLIAEIKLPEGKFSSKIDFSSHAEGVYILNFLNNSGNIIKSFRVEKLK